MPVYLQATTATSGDAEWVAAAAAGGGITGVKQRVQLADIAVADVNTGGFFADGIPANAMVLGAAYYVTALPSGGGVGSCQVNVGMDIGAPYNTIDGLELEELIGGSLGYNTNLNNNQEFGLNKTMFLLLTTAITPFWSVTADVNLNTLATFDVTFYWFYSVPTGITLP